MFQPFSFLNQNCPTDPASLKASTPLKGHPNGEISLSQKIYGRITNYRTGPKSQTSKECLIEFQGLTSAALVGKIVGQKVAWKGANRTQIGQIMGAHGRNGMVRARFNQGVPGQAIGTIVELLK